MSHTILDSFHCFVSELWPFDCFVMIILCKFQACTPHNLGTVWNIFIKCYSNMYKVINDDAPLINFHPIFPQQILERSKTTYLSRDAFIKNYWNIYQVKMMRHVQ